MEKIKFIDDYEVLLPPYWLIEYLDEEARKHIAMTKDKEYIQYLKLYFKVLSIKAIAE